MRRATCFLILLASCSGESVVDSSPAPGTPVLPANLAKLLLAEASDEITPVAFDHAAHANAADPTRPGLCSTCHHNLKDEESAIPRPCTGCHPMEPEDHAPPDL